MEYTMKLIYTVLIALILCSCSSKSGSTSSGGSVSDYIFHKVPRNYANLANDQNSLINRYASGQLSLDQQIVTATKILNHPHRRLMECKDDSDLYSWLKKYRKDELRNFSLRFPNGHPISNLAAGYYSCVDALSYSEKSKYRDTMRQLEELLPLLKQKQARSLR